MSKKSLSKLTQQEDIITEPIFIIKIVCNNDVYEATGDNLHELIINFTPPPLVKNETNFIVTKKNKVIQQDLKVFEARRLFNNKTSMLLFTNKLIARLG